MSALIEFDDVCKYYQMGDTTVKAVDHISMQINKGEFVAIVGQSGSGKSTCMNIIGCLDVAGLHLPAVQPSAQAQPDGKRGAAPDLRRAVPQRAAGPRQDGPPAGGPGGQAEQQAQPALGRPAAARLHCPGPGRGAGGHPGRRAHRRPGQPYRPRGAGHFAETAPPGQHGGPDHPRQLHRGAGRADHPAGGWAHRLRRRLVQPAFTVQDAQEDQAQPEQEGSA